MLKCQEPISLYAFLPKSTSHAKKSPEKIFERFYHVLIKLRISIFHTSTPLIKCRWIYVT